MIPTVATRSVLASEVVASAEFGISLNDSAHIMTILRDTLYTDKVLAVLREYGSNAWDAHRQAGKADVPIKVTLPTHIEPTLSIRDYGRGLSRNDIFRVFTQYGASTKRDSDNEVGMLGIGSKSGFAYADSFVVVSYYDGIKSTYVAALDESEKGIINLLDEQACAREETGVLIQLAIQKSDIQEFQNKAMGLYKYFVPRPEINVTLPELPKMQSHMKNGIIYHDVTWDYRNWVAVMGCVPYHVDLAQVKNFEEGLPAYFRELSGAIFFDIGDVHINASREELKYSNKTKRAIIDKLNALAEEYVLGVLKELDAGPKSMWEKRLMAQTLKKFSLNVPKSHVDLLSHTVILQPDSLHKLTKFTVKREGAYTAQAVEVRPNAKFIIKDDKRSIKGYRFGRDDYLILPVKGVDDAVLELDKIIVHLKMDGIPITKTSQLPWTPASNAIKEANAKHKLNVFKWNPKNMSCFSVPYSDFWDAESREPTDADVYVEISEFKVDGLNLFSAYKDDLEACTIMGKQMPEIYAYKVTLKNPSVPRQGTHYLQWRANLLKELFAHKEFNEKYQTFMWAQADRDSSYRSRPMNMAFIDKIDIPDDHIIKQFMKKKVLAKAIVDKQYNSFDLIRKLQNRAGIVSDAETMINKIHQRYPMFSIMEPLYEGFEQFRDIWVDYIKLVDRSNA